MTGRKQSTDGAARPGCCTHEEGVFEEFLRFVTPAQVENIIAGERRVPKCPGADQPVERRERCFISRLVGISEAAFGDLALCGLYSQDFGDGPRECGVFIEKLQTKSGFQSRPHTTKNIYLAF